HTPDTEHLVSAELLQLLRPNSILINTARAEVVDTEALFTRLRDGRLFGAGLDVFESEPPEIATLPLENLNLVLTPHIGFHTDEADEVFGIAGQNIVAFADGIPRNVITKNP
ncbi:NAD(P)-dependent oxidoreductase, partial [Paeniglutamicibacter sp.]|uniref:NAD(P)-dependent oxidoreductase n=1 Tax=Paeniglutamicibacter sp. TaxID=1934391 RepID=UPI003989C745